MRVTDVPDPGRISRRPDDVVTILERPHTLHGSTVSRMELRLYTEGDPSRPYSIITAYLEMDGHSIETIYDEGYRGDTPPAGRGGVPRVQCGSVGGNTPGQGGPGGGAGQTG